MTRIRSMLAALHREPGYPQTAEPLDPHRVRLPWPAPRGRDEWRVTLERDSDLAAHLGAVLAGVFSVSAEHSADGYGPALTSYSPQRTTAELTGWMREHRILDRNGRPTEAAVALVELLDHEHTRRARAARKTNHALR